MDFVTKVRPNEFNTNEDFLNDLIQTTQIQIDKIHNSYSSQDSSHNHYIKARLRVRDLLITLAKAMQNAEYDTMIDIFNKTLEKAQST